MVAAYIGIGSNLDAPVKQVCAALGELEVIPSTFLTAQSSLYRSAPLGPADQPDYINAAARVETALSPYDLLNYLQAIENSHGRVRSIRWGPRSLDLDLLLYADLEQSDPRLTIPHPSMHERIFVLQPLFDIDPDLYIPGWGKIKILRLHCPALDIEPLKIKCGDLPTQS